MKLAKARRRSMNHSCRAPAQISVLRRDGAVAGVSTGIAAQFPIDRNSPEDRARMST